MGRRALMLQVLMGRRALMLQVLMPPILIANKLYILITHISSLLEIGTLAFYFILLEIWTFWYATKSVL